MKNQFFETSAAFLKPAAPAGYVADEKPEYNWTADRQPMALPDFATHIKVAHHLSFAYLSLVADIVIKAGYEKPENKDRLISRIADATGRTSGKKDKNKLHLDGVTIYWREKNEQSCDIKVVASMLEGKSKDPNNTGDYFGVRLVGHSVEDVVKLRNAARATSATSWKCEYSHPSTEGFRSHKSHHQVEHVFDLQKFGDQYIANLLAKRAIPKTEAERADNEVWARVEFHDFLAKLPPGAITETTLTLQSKGEVFISDAAGERIDEFTHSLKKMRGELIKNAAELSTQFTSSAGLNEEAVRQLSSMSNRWGTWAEEADAFRTFCNDYTYYNAGFDVLTAPGKERGAPEMPEKLSRRLGSQITHSGTSVPEDLRIPLIKLVGKHFVEEHLRRGDTSSAPKAFQ